MPDHSARLRKAIQLSAGATPRATRYPPDLHQEILTYVAEQSALGASVSATASALGLRTATLYLWRRQSHRRCMRPVHLVEPTAAAATVARAVVITPEGWRIEGLDIDSIVRLIRPGA